MQNLNIFETWKNQDLAKEISNSIINLLENKFCDVKLTLEDEVVDVNGNKAVYVTALEDLLEDAIMDIIDK